jgi:hypothetical protein
MISFTSFLPKVAIAALIGLSKVHGFTLRARDCTFQWPAATGDTCQSMALDWDITEADFIRWNSGVDCNALVNGQDYCLSWDGAEPSLSSSSSSTLATITISSTRTPTPTPTPIPTGHTPTQSGIASNCKARHIILFPAKRSSHIHLRPKVPPRLLRRHVR